MDEKKMDTVPQLSLDTQEVPTLTLDLEAAVDQPFTPKPEPPQDAVFDESSLTEAERKMVNDFAEKIQISNSNLVLQYGSGAQKKIADFSETALNNVRTKDMSEVGEMLTNVVVELKKFNVDEEEKGLFSFFKRSGNKISTYKAKYASAEANVNRICNVLEDHQVQLMKDIAMLDKMYDMNKLYFKELSMYILAGKKKLAEVQATDLPAAQEKARRTGLPEDAQAANDLSAMCNRFEKKLHDLELTRTISIQMAPQIRLIQNNDTLMTEKIQMVLALGVAHSQQAADAQKAVTDMTNELLRKNAETLKMSSIETAKQSERGIVDIETLKTTNESLISTLDEVMRIQQEGRQKRQEAETELRRIENDLKNKLLEMR